jgi:hypothetical protein
MQGRTRLPNKLATTSCIVLIHFIDLRLHSKEEGLFHFYVSFENAHFEQLRGSFERRFFNRAVAGY